MDSGIKILFVSRNQQILDTVVRLIEAKEGWKAYGCLSDENAVEQFLNLDIDLVMFGSGIDLQSEIKLCNIFKIHKPHIPVIQHYGGGSGLLFGEINTALSLK